MTNVRRTSSIREVTICNPLTKTKHAENHSVAPRTGRGMMAKSAAALGRKASTTNMPPITYAMRRLVTPVALASPTLLVKVLTPMVPQRPAIAVDKPLASTPPLIERMPGRVHSASLIFWHVVMSPMARRQAASAATPNGIARPRSNDHPP